MFDFHGRLTVGSEFDAVRLCGLYLSRVALHSVQLYGRMESLASVGSVGLNVFVGFVKSTGQPG